MHTNGPIGITPFQARGSLRGFVISGRWPDTTKEWAQVLVLAVRVATMPGLLATSTVLAGFPILLAVARTVRNAVKLGNRAGSPAELSRLARSICRDHLVGLGCTSAFLVLWVVTAGPGTP